MSEKRKRGTVYLVGAGPGDPKLITVKGLEALKRADVVIYDHLVSERLLDHCRPKTTIIYAGKEKDKHTKSQGQINRLLVRYAKVRKVVVRLKGGDPVLFGRAGEEALALAKAKIPYEIVPGVTSAIAVPAYAGIPVTYRQLSSSVAIITGHEDPAKPGSTIRWGQLATATDTLVCLMGVGALAKIVEQLVRSGRSKTVPCAVIEWGTLPTQRTVVGTLGTIVRRCEQVRLKPPAVVVVGEVVTLRRWLNWFEHKPLFGQRIVVTRPTDRSEHLAELLEELGAEVISLPAIELAPVKSNGLFPRAIRRIEEFDWIFFTSPEGISWFQRLLASERKDLRILRGRHIGAIGPKTAASIEQRGIHVDFVPTTFSQEGMLGGLSRRRLAGRRALILSAEDSRDVLERGLKVRGMNVVRVPIYRTLVPATLLKQIKQVFGEPMEPRPAAGGDGATSRAKRGIDLVSVTSSSCVDHLVDAMNVSGFAKMFGHLRFASIGPVTSATVRQHGGKVAVEARISTIEGLVEAIVSLVCLCPANGRGRQVRQRGGQRRAIPRLSTTSAPAA